MAAVDVKRARTGPIPAAAAASEAVLAAVLGNDDLLREILLRLGFPTTLVRAALVSKRWLRHASDPAFLRLFRARHPPALLGFYVNNCSLPEELEPAPPEFVPISQAPELATAVRRAGFPDDDVWERVLDCRNGRGIVRSRSALCHSSQFAVIDLLHQTRGVARFPPPFPHPDDCIFLPVSEDGGVPAPLDGRNGMVAVEVIYYGTRTMIYTKVYTYRSCDDDWTVRTSPVVSNPNPSDFIIMDVLPVNGKIYMATDGRYILLLDLVSTSISTIMMPDRVRTANFKLLCREEDSGLFVIHADECKLSIWHRMADGDGANTWVLVHDKIIVHEAASRHEDVFVMTADNSLEYVFFWLEASRRLMHIQLKSWSEKVYDELKVYDVMLDRNIQIRPFIMVWPPVFPALRGEDNLEA